MITPTTIALDLLIENVPERGAWSLRCRCGAALTLAYRDRGTDAATLIATHDGFPARFELRGSDDDSLLWAIGAADPLGAWLEIAHEWIGDTAAGCAASAGEVPA